MADGKKVALPCDPDRKQRIDFQERIDSFPILVSFQAVLGGLKALN